METPAAQSPTPRSAADELRAVAMPWALSGMLPLPILVVVDPATSGDIACLYLGLACGWLAMEIFRSGSSGRAESPGEWCAKTLATLVAVAINVAVFILFGVAAGVQTHFPFPAMAALSAVPAVGLVPWLTRRVRQPYAAILLAGVLVFAAKLAGCVVARFVYGPNYIAEGYVSADWRSAKLMISLFWILSASLSLALLLADGFSSTRSRTRAVPDKIIHALIPLMVLALFGCGKAGGGAPASAPAILQPFQGAWRFSLPKTIAYWQANGVPATEIAQAQAIAKSFPLHPDMNIANDLAVLPGPVEGQYQFFALHPHNQWVCGKAWHHEDRHDPGDMDKYLVRLELRDGDLYLSVRIHDDAANPADPDVTNTPLTAGSAATCGADAAPTPPWSPWRTYVFQR